LQLHHCLHINSNNNIHEKKKKTTEVIIHRNQTSSATTARKSSLPSTVRSDSNSRMYVMNASITFTNHPRQDCMFQCLGIAI
jgi:hypothetical protein